ncbi:Cytochrome P450 6j1 [Blattella germanica]|nr:Cytochrome P450 6j1 [Blattella germanica]
MELKRKNEMENGSVTTQSFKFVEDDYTAQAFQFLIAGFETSSSTMSYTLYQMALNPDIQKRLSTEIREVLKKNNNQITYDSLQDMKYLDMVVSETLRMYPPLPFLDRKCTEDYKLPAPSGKGNITIPAGTGIYVPLLGIHYDPEYFPNPEKYDPERFTEENKQHRPAYSYMPFGEGPRICIVKDSQTFLDHLTEMNESVDPLFSRSLFRIKGRKWKHMRNNLSPTFTSGKLKHMFYLVDKCAKELDNYMDSQMSGGKNFEMLMFYASK